VLENAVSRGEMAKKKPGEPGFHVQLIVQDD
jgi:hypothetical protein